jgi:hypothetical protein
MNFNMMFEYTAIGNAMKMSGRTYEQLTDDEKNDYILTMDVMKRVDVSSAHPIMPMYIPMPVPWYMVADNTNDVVDARIDSVEQWADEQMTDIKHAIANNLAQHIDDVSDLKEGMQNIKTELNESVQTLTEITDKYELNNNKIRKKQYLVNYSIWLWLVVTTFSNYNGVINSQVNNIIYSVLVILQIYIVSIITTD